MLIIETRARDLGGFAVKRLLPSPRRRMVGPFLFFDHFGPSSPGQGIDVRPHPHIGLATVTYLFEGEVFHRDSLGSALPIQPGAVNWMVAGRGIVHSERNSPGFDRGGRIEGVQAWVALPAEKEEMAPDFTHYPAARIPLLTPAPGVQARLLAGEAFGDASPVITQSPTLYAELRLAAGAQVELPFAPERAVYVVSGAVSIDGTPGQSGQMVVLPSDACLIAAHTDAHLMLLGGAPLPEQRHIWWNLVSSRPARIAQAAEDWRAGRFPTIPGDDQEFIPAPDGP